jgi:sulfur relay (sulfurtransferase) complex TusBCD TusD component (DsrE family)
MESNMKKLLILSSLLMSLAGSANVLAGDADPLFINMTSDDGHRATMAIAFGSKQHAKGHALTVFLNDKGVLVGSKAHAKKFGDQQKDLIDAMSKGATVIICPMCMKKYKVAEADLLPGIKVGSPDVTGAALFKDNTKTLTW